MFFLWSVVLLASGQTPAVSPPGLAACVRAGDEKEEERRLLAEGDRAKPANDATHPPCCHLSNPSRNHRRHPPAQLTHHIFSALRAHTTCFEVQPFFQSAALVVDMIAPSPVARSRLNHNARGFRLCSGRLGAPRTSVACVAFLRLCCLRFSHNGGRRPPHPFPPRLESCVCWHVA